MRLRGNNSRAQIIQPAARLLPKPCFFVRGKGQEILSNVVYRGRGRILVEMND
jgi:hypothetical protein